MVIWSMVAAPLLHGQQLLRDLETEKDETRDALAAHPLAWWTEEPLRLDASGDLMLGFNAPDGRPITVKDYRVEEEVVTIGTISGHRILQVQISIHPGPRVIAGGYAYGDDNAGEWKDLLVETAAPGVFVDIYALHYDVGGLVKETKAEIFGSGPEAILRSYDPTTGNGGGCLEGTWWFDQEGAHAVDFSPLMRAVSQAIPANATFTHGCWALHPESSELKSWVQRSDAECHGCGGLGEVRARYRIEHGVAGAVSIDFKPAEAR